MIDWPRRALACILPFVPPPVARSICMRAGLDHEVLVDRRDGFDAQHYGRSVGRRFRTDEAALFHYLVVGSRTGSQPRPGFDPARYLRQNPDVALAGYEPFAHYLRFGRHEGRGLNIEADDALTQPDLSRMLQYPARKVDAATVDVVMPVYGNRRLTLRAIDSVLASQQVTPFELLVIDDDSPEPGLRGDLKLLAEAGQLTLLINEQNCGFVRTANRGMAAHPDRDVVLLNSDTEVYGPADGGVARFRPDGDGITALQRSDNPELPGLSAGRQPSPGNRLRGAGSPMRPPGPFTGRVADGLGLLHGHQTSLSGRSRLIR